MRCARAVPMTDPLLSRLDPRSFQEIARMVLDTPTFEWIRSGSGAEFGGDNETAFGRRRLRPSGARRRVHRVDRYDTPGCICGAPCDGRSDGPPEGRPPGWRTGHGRRRGACRQPARLSRSTPRPASTISRQHNPTSPYWSQLYNWDNLRCAGRGDRPGRGGRLQGDRPARQYPARREPHVLADRVPAAGRREVRALRVVAGAAGRPTPGTTSAGCVR